MIICHGIPGSRPNPHDRGYLPLVEAIVAGGFNAVLFNFCGCGESDGDIDMQAWYMDLLQVHDLVANVPGVDPTALHAIGFSAGGAIAAKAAGSERLFQSLLLMATPADFAAILPDDPLVLREHFQSLGLIRAASFPRDVNAWYRAFLDLKAARWLPFLSPRPLAIVHGLDDTVVPVRQAQVLYDAALDPKRLTLIEGAPHQLRRDPRTAGLVMDWLTEVAGGYLPHA